MTQNVINNPDIQQYRDNMDEQFYLDPQFEHSFYYLCGEYVPFPAVCYIKKENFQYKVQFVPIDRSIEYNHGHWIIVDDIDKFIWNNRYNIYYSELPYEELIS